MGKPNSEHKARDGSPLTATAGSRNESRVTDALSFVSEEFGYRVVCADFARRMERERNEAKEALAELYAAMVRYEVDVDGEAPPEHHRMMDRVRGILFPENG